jgi:hypothetical protein
VAQKAIENGWLCVASCSLGIGAPKDLTENRRFPLTYNRAVLGEFGRVEIQARVNLTPGK